MGSKTSFRVQSASTVRGRRTDFSIKRTDLVGESGDCPFRVRVFHQSPIIEPPSGFPPIMYNLSSTFEGWRERLLGQCFENWDETRSIRFTLAPSDPFPCPLVGGSGRSNLTTGWRRLTRDLVAGASPVHGARNEIGSNVSR